MSGQRQSKGVVRVKMVSDILLEAMVGKDRYWRRYYDADTSVKHLYKTEHLTGG